MLIQIQLQLALVHVEFQIFGEGRHMGVEHRHELCEDREPPRQVGKRGVGCVTWKSVLLAPGLPSLVVFGDGQAGSLQFVLVDWLAVPGQGGVIETGDKD